MDRKIILTWIIFVGILFVMHTFESSATELLPTTDGQSTETETVEYKNKTFYRKANGWYIPSELVYNGSDLDTILDSLVLGRKRSIVKYSGYKYIRVSGGWYRMEINAYGGSTLDKILDELAESGGATTTTTE